MGYHGISRRRAIGGMVSASAAAIARPGRIRAQGAPIRIGIMMTASGPLAAVGQPHLTGARIAAKEINDGGGIDGRTIELLVRDTHASATEMLTGLRELAGQGVSVIMGDTLAVTNLAAIPIVPSLNQVLVIPTVSAIEITHEMFNRNTFRCAPNAYMVQFGEGKLVADRYPALARWATVQTDTVGFQVAVKFVRFGLEKTAEKTGRKVEFGEPVLAKLGESDYRNQIGQILAQNPQGLILGLGGGEAITFLKQARGLGLFGKLTAIADISLSIAAGIALKQQTPSGFWTTCTWTPDAYKQYPMAQAFFKDVVAETKDTNVNPWVAQAHVTITAIAAALRAAKSTAPDAVIPALETAKFDSIYGPMQFRAEDHQILMDPAFIRLGPAESDAGWKIEEFVRIPWKDAIEAPKPGQEIRDLSGVRKANPAPPSEPFGLAMSDGVRIVGEAWGPVAGPAILFAHGGGQTRHAWSRVASRIAEGGWRALAVDLRGHGDSGWSPRGDYTYHRFAEDLAALADTMSPPPVVVGASFSGNCAILAAAAHSRRIFRAIIVVDVTPRLEREGHDRIIRFMERHLDDGFATPEDAAAAVAEYGTGRTRPPNVENLKRNLRMRPDGRYRWHWDPATVRGERNAQMTPELSDELWSAARTVTIPVLLIRGSKSDIVTDDAAREFMAAVPHAEFCDVADASHMIVGDRNDSFAGRLSDFLGRLQQGRVSGANPN